MGRHGGSIVYRSSFAGRFSVCHGEHPRRLLAYLCFSSVPVRRIISTAIFLIAGLLFVFARCLFTELVFDLCRVLQSQRHGFFRQFLNSPKNI
jgi:hypothetical protein